ncbi:MAG: Rab family GTPase [Anaerolineales bacterium]|jgi:small GTP-binding protein
MTSPRALKVIFAGDGEVGKTSLIRRHCEGRFEVSRIETIGVDFQSKMVMLATGPVKLSIWDMAGQERFQVVRSGLYRGSRCAALVFDATKPESLANLTRWRDEILAVVPSQRFAVVANKVDLLPRNGRGPQPSWGGPPKIPQALDYADSVGADYLETSALTGEGVLKLFETMARLARGTLG